MRIAINGTFWDKPTTGSGQYLRGLLPALARLDASNDYALIVPYHETARDGIPARVSVSYAPAALDGLGENLGKVWFEQIAFGRACVRARAALAHVPYFAPPLFPRTRTVVTIHDLIPMILPLYRGSPLVRLYTRLAAAGARRARAIIADSECSRRDIVRYLKVAPAHVRVVHLAADERYRPVNNAAEMEAVRRKYALPGKFLLYLGGFDQRKNVRVLIEAFARRAEFYRSGYRLVLAGVTPGKHSHFFPDPHRIARQVETPLPDDAIRHTGWVDEADKPALYASATVFLFPSLYEGFGLPPLEAMACGTPVIASNAAALPEIVGAAAMQVDPKDADAWADALGEVLSDDARRAEMSARGIAQSKKFSWERAAAETLAAYRSALA